MVPVADVHILAVQHHVHLIIMEVTADVLPADAVDAVVAVEEETKTKNPALLSGSVFGTSVHR